MNAMIDKCPLQLNAPSADWQDWFSGIRDNALLECRQKLSRALIGSGDADIERILYLARGEEAVRWETELLVSNAVNQGRLL